ncbi:peptide chain release factor N(5)-glutamine methyltransferase [Hyphomonas sp.]|uniref:peptide chain release factor N(5)-glutamine methyltransferase n=1 Tax=Hyphomonas sp. TaxID=87 RepID=UPI001BCDE21F
MSETLAAAERRIAQELAAAGIGEAALEARLMLSHVTRLSRATMIAQSDRALTPDETQACRQALSRRSAREPLQHILGVTQFYGLDIRTDARALIPRPDSECVVEAALDRLPKDQSLALADLGTGTGCLLAALLTQRPQARGEGVEASPEAAELARENIEALGLTDRASIFSGSWADWHGWARADLIISNPPYIASGVIPALEAEVRDHDPMSALDGGADGLDAYRQIIFLARAAMKPGAWLVLETGYDQKAAVMDLLAASGFVEAASGADLGGNDRWAAARRPL